MNDLLGKMITVNYNTIELGSDSISGVLESYTEKKGSTIFKLNYPREGDQRAAGVVFSVRDGDWSVVEGEVEYE